MNNSSMQQYLRYVYNASGIPVSVFENDVWLYGYGIFSEPSENGLLNPFLCDPELLGFLTDGDKPVCYFMEEDRDNGVYYGIFRTEGICVILGPGSAFKLPRGQLIAYAARHKISNTRDFTIPKVSREQASALLAIISCHLTGSLIAPAGTEPIQNDPGSVGIPEHLNEYYRMDNIEKDVQHFPYSIEERAWSCIEAGDLEGLERMGEDVMSGYVMGKVAETPGKQEEYSAVAAIAVALRVAIRGGVNPYRAYDLGDLYLQRVEKCKSKDQYWPIYIEALRQFTLEVKKAKKNNEKPIHVKKAQDYIFRHINSRLTLQEIADHVGISPQYLSAVFSRTEQTTLQKFILREKVERAKNLLIFSDYSISQISEYLCFPSQSHFGQAFKNFYGETPSAYRRRNKIKSF